LGAIALGSASSALVGAVIGLVESLPIPTRMVGASLAVGAAASLLFWTLRLASPDSAGRRVRPWLIGLYALGVTSLVGGFIAAISGPLADGLDPGVHLVASLLLVIEVGEHFGARWIDGQGRWLKSPWLGGAARAGLRQRVNRRQ
jgi:hypothetical protein